MEKDILYFIRGLGTRGRATTPPPLHHPRSEDPASYIKRRQKTRRSTRILRADVVLPPLAALKRSTTSLHTTQSQRGRPVPSAVRWRRANAAMAAAARTPMGRPLDSRPQPLLRPPDSALWPECCVRRGEPSTSRVVWPGPPRCCLSARRGGASVGAHRLPSPRIIHAHARMRAMRQPQQLQAAAVQGWRSGGGG